MCRISLSSWSWGGPLPWLRWHCAEVRSEQRCEFVQPSRIGTILLPHALPNEGVLVSTGKFSRCRPGHPPPISYGSVARSASVATAAAAICAPHQDATPGPHPSRPSPRCKPLVSKQIPTAAQQQYSPAIHRQHARGRLVQGPVALLASCLLGRYPWSRAHSARRRHGDGRKRQAARPVITPSLAPHATPLVLMPSRRGSQRLNSCLNRACRSRLSRDGALARLPRIANRSLLGRALVTLSPPRIPFPCALSDRKEGGR